MERILLRLTLTLLWALQACGGPCLPRGWEDALDQTITVEGIARNAKLGAMVQTESGTLWVDGLDAWPDRVANKRVSVRGRLIERHDLPVHVHHPGEPPKSGMPVPEGADLQKAAARYLLTDAHWEPAE